MSWSAIRVQFEGVELISMSLQHRANVRSSLAKTFMGLAVCDNNYLGPLRHSKNVLVILGTDRIGNCEELALIGSPIREGVHNVQAAATPVASECLTASHRWIVGVDVSD
jgi:hypothetical protein